MWTQIRKFRKRRFSNSPMRLVDRASVSVTGTTTYPSGTSLNVLIDGAVVGSTTVTNGAYSTSVSISANDTPDAVTDTIELQGP